MIEASTLLFLLIGWIIAPRTCFWSALIGVLIFTFGMLGAIRAEWLGEHTFAAYCVHPICGAIVFAFARFFLPEVNRISSEKAHPYAVVAGILAGAGGLLIVSLEVITAGKSEHAIIVYMVIFPVSIVIAQIICAWKTD